MSATFAESAKDAVSLTKACELVPGRPHAATIWRWATRGVRGIRLATIIVGGRRMVTPQALEQFLQRLNADQPADQSDTEANMIRRAKVAGDALEKLGC